ncbi:YihA family ribosome biogenesis GTP-binding protein, partial [Oscillospiraceae bacterium OttesenSCG-928-G22]|nr:YihA family ribosome biogenesis GTP-binding protein [Oscillospiraceae bacterium OttesenSCG-928-G22]
PGYGYARVSHDEKRRWATLMDNFFSSGEHTDLSVLIVDARRAPTEDDRVMCEYLKQMDMPYLVIMNKADKLKKREIDDAKARVSDTLDLSDEVTVFPFSAVKREGVDLLWDELLSYSADALTIR